MYTRGVTARSRATSERGGPSSGVRRGRPGVLAHLPRAGRYVLAGSTRFLTTPSLSESLAGRVAVVDVWPFSQGEFESKFERFIDIAFDNPGQLRDLAASDADRANTSPEYAGAGSPSQP